MNSLNGIFWKFDGLDQISIRSTTFSSIPFSFHLCHDSLQRSEIEESPRGSSSRRHDVWYTRRSRLRWQLSGQALSNHWIVSKVYCCYFFLVWSYNFFSWMLNWMVDDNLFEFIWSFNSECIFLAVLFDFVSILIIQVFLFWRS